MRQYWSARNDLDWYDTVEKTLFKINNLHLSQIKECRAFLDLLRIEARDFGQTGIWTNLSKSKQVFLSSAPKLVREWSNLRCRICF